MTQQPARFGVLLLLTMEYMSRKPIPTKVHGMLDYASGALFIASPWLFKFADNKAARRVAVGTGVAVLGLSALTNYEAGLSRQIPMRTHLNVDTLNGVLVAASPWLFGFAKRKYWPHLAFGLLEVGAGLLTRRKPADV
ncbi:SPW repeat domain-containing protein [Rudanella lutea]|uniref:SPW repeat domain-containing protein n=1 Tax=Rudanella lutea TaxID=451374 RepID=UPI0003A60485|nr:SPW repeat protein [Rudanella lutea]